METSELRSWGEPYNPSFQHSGDTHCPHCYWSLVGHGSKGFFAHVIGFSVEVPKSNREGKIAGFIVECDECQEKYWFHTGWDTINTCKKVGAWPTN